MSTLFISDLHLHPDLPVITQRFEELLAELPGKIKKLYILGDLFEAWIGDDNLTTFNKKIIGLLHKLTTAGVEIYVMRGNRDFLLGDQFAKMAGITMLTDPTIVNLNGEPTLLMHGDNLVTDDQIFMEYLAKVRNPQFQQRILAKPLWVRRCLARYLRWRSRLRHRFNKDEAIMDVNQQAVIDTMMKYGVKTLIHGHTHRPAIHDFQHDGKNFRRIVLSDWGNKGNFLLYRQGDIVKLHYFSSQQEVIFPPLQ